MFPINITLQIMVTEGAYPAFAAVAVFARNHLVAAWLCYVFHSQSFVIFLGLKKIRCIICRKSSPLNRMPKLRTIPSCICLALGLAAFLAVPPAHAAFGATPVNGGYLVDNGANLVFTINHSGDMPSCKFKGTELNDPRRASCIGSGLGASSVNARTNGNVIVITCVSTAISPTALTHYYLVSNGLDDIFMATYITSEPRIGELRYIFRGQFDLLPNGPPDSNNNASTGPVESRDVFGHRNGTVTSKYYGSERAKDLTLKGATGGGVGVFTAFGDRESDMGGPFVRDIENQGDGMGSDQEIYNYMNSGHHLNLIIAGHPEQSRTNVLYGPYAFCFTGGSIPSVPDMSFVANLGLTGYVGSSARGRVVLERSSGMNPAYPYYLGFANPTAQYWTALSATGSGECDAMKPGDYSMTIYKNELAVWTGSVSVTAGASTTLPPIVITGDPDTVPVLWRIGHWDGTPLEFLNGGNLMHMHPSDVRNRPWGPVTFTVGSSSTASFPSCQFRGINDPSTVLFNLTSPQAASAHTFKIGITDAYDRGRPQVTINGRVLRIPGASVQPGARSLTTGTYRGNNTTFSWSIPANDFVAGPNTITITATGNLRDLSPSLSAAFSYDCIELDD